MKRFFTFLKTELKLSLRDMNMPVFAIFMPLVIFIILGIICGTKPAYDGADYTFMGSWALTMLSTQSIGMLAGGVAKDTKQASVIASILYFPMLVFSGTTLPIEVMPKAMQKIVSFFPLTQGLTMMKNTFLGISTGSILLPICVMLGLTMICTVLAIRFFRWE